MPGGRGGEVAARKVSLLRRAGVNVSVVSPTLCKSLASEVATGNISHRYARDFGSHPPRYTGIPLTHRDYAQSYVFVTGRVRDGSMDLNWDTLVQPQQTIVIYMALKGLTLLCQADKTWNVFRYAGSTYRTGHYTAPAGFVGP